MEPEQRRDVAVADEDLLRRPHPIDVDQGEELGAAVAAADGDDRCDGRVVPRIMECGDPGDRVAGDEAIAIEYALVVHRLEAEATKFGHTGVELVALESARGRDQRDAVARSKPTVA